MNSTSTILLTGSTGFLGRELLGRLLVSDPASQLCLPIRPSASESAEARANKLLLDVFGDARLAASHLPRVRPLNADITEPRLGLGTEDFSRLASSLSGIYHCAATTHLNQDLATSRRVNVGGTMNLLDLAKLAAGTNPNFRFHHVSTAYVAGSTEDVVREDELDLKRSFRNTYERTKAEAEAAVRAARDEVHVRIYRPSIIVGDSVTGQTSSFNVLYIPVRFVMNGLFKVVPALPHAPFDVVPVDYVADAIVALAAADQTSGSCFHLCAGNGRESTPREILEVVKQVFLQHRSRHLHVPAFISPELLARALSSFSAAAEGLLSLEKRVCEHLKIFRQTVPFIPYMLGNPRFDTSQAARALGPCAAPAPLFASYAERIFSYCLETNWGRIPWTNPANYCTWLHRLPA